MYKISIALLLFLISLTACTGPNTGISTQATDLPTQHPTGIVSIGDGGLISGKPCASPCFFGIRVGETPLQQVIPTLENNNISPCYQIDELNIFCSDTDVAKVSVTVNESTLVVNGVGYDPDVSISVQNVIEKYGNPSLIQIELDRTNGTPESPILLMSLLWDQTKMGVALPDKNDSEEQFYDIENTTDIEWVSFYDDITYSKIAASESSKPWQGYGTYKP